MVIIMDKKHICTIEKSSDNCSENNGIKKPQSYDIKDAASSDITMLHSSKSDILEVPKIDLSGFANTLNNSVSDNLIQTYYNEKENIRKAFLSIGKINYIDLSAINVSYKETFGKTLLNLAELEKKTFQLSGIKKESFVSVSNQIVEISNALNKTVSDSNFISVIERFLSEYNSFAIKQNKKIQKNIADIKEIKWRTDLLKSVSGLVNEQVAWSLSIKGEISEGVDGTEEVSEESFINLIPEYVGYTKRNDINKSIDDAIEESPLTIITNKGKTIAEKIIEINKSNKDENGENAIKYTDKVAEAIIFFSTVICTNVQLLEKLIKYIYFVFYENLEHLKKIIGQGDIDKGDKEIKGLEKFQVIFNTKTIRTEFEHDYEHGTEGKINNKRKSILKTYEHYCGKRPLKERDFRVFQDKIYDEIISMEDYLLELIRT